MASIFKRDGRDGKPAAKYSIKYKDARGKWKTVAGCPDLESSRKLAKKLESEATLRRNGVQIETDLKAILPIVAYGRYLKEIEGDGHSHIQLTVSQIKAIATACGFDTLNDLRQPDSADKVINFLMTKRKESKRKQLKDDRKRDRSVVYATEENLGLISTRTKNAYIVAFKGFCKWCLETKKIPDCSLLFTLKRVKDGETVVRRRAASDREVARILQATIGGGTVGGLDGRDRYYLYRVAVATGFRASELQSLRPNAFKLKVKVPYILLDGKNAKNKKEAQQPIRPELAAELANWLKGKAPGEPVWRGRWHKRAAEMLRSDLTAAKVPFSVEGRVLDFHSLRGTFITSLSRAGVQPAYAQKLARHSDVNLTMKAYTHLPLEELASVLPESAPLAHQGSGKSGHSGSLRVTRGRRKRA